MFDADRVNAAFEDAEAADGAVGEGLETRTTFVPTIILIANNNDIIVRIVTQIQRQESHIDLSLTPIKRSRFCWHFRARFLRSCDCGLVGGQFFDEVAVHLEAALHHADGEGFEGADVYEDTVFFLD